MKRILVFCTLLCVPSIPGQSPNKPSFLNAAVLQHHGESTTLTTNFPRPLLQAVEGLSEEYDWIVDFEIRFIRHPRR